MKKASSPFEAFFVDCKSHPTYVQYHFVFRD